MISITSILKIDRGHSQRVYTFLFHFSSFVSFFSFFTSTSSFAPYSTLRATLIIPVHRSVFFSSGCSLSLPRFRHVYAVTPWPIPRKSIRYARGYRTLLRAVVTLLTVSPWYKYCAERRISMKTIGRISFSVFPSSPSFSLSLLFSLSVSFFPFCLFLSFTQRCNCLAQHWRHWWWFSRHIAAAIM